MQPGTAGWWPMPPVPGMYERRAFAGLGRPAAWFAVPHPDSGAVGHTRVQSNDGFIRADSVEPGGCPGQHFRGVSRFADEALRDSMGVRGRAQRGELFGEPEAQNTRL